jgi:ribosome-associated protein
MERREIPIRGDMIRLGQLLKLAGVVDTGGELGWYLDETPLTVNGEPENRRGRQLHPGDTVETPDAVLVVVTKGV